jgi:hypothetical protein
MDNDRTIIPSGPGEHHRQIKIAWCQHIKQTLQQLHKSDDLFLDNSITHAEDKRTAIAKSNTNNAKHVAIDSTHAQCNQLTIKLAQCGRNMTYRFGSVFNQTLKKLNRNKHVSIAKQNKVHLFDATTTPSIRHMTLEPMDTTSVNKTNAKQASLFCDHLHSRLGLPMGAQATKNMLPNSPFANYLHG